MWRDRKDRRSEFTLHLRGGGQGEVRGWPSGPTQPTGGDCSHRGWVGWADL